MKNKIFLALLLLLLPNFCLAAAAPEDLTVNGVNLITSRYADVVAKLGKPKFTVDGQGDDLTWTYLNYPDLRVVVNTAGKLVYIRIDGRDVALSKGVEIGATPYKIVKEYGEPEKQNLDGHIYYIYKIKAGAEYRLVFDMTDQYASHIFLTSLPTVP